MTRFYKYKIKFLSDIKSGRKSEFRYIGTIILGMYIGLIIIMYILNK